ncbi:MAG: MFS transporter [Acidimicrobiales bacterium]
MTAADEVVTSSPPATNVARAGRSPSSFAVPGYPLLWTTGWLWHVARWMAVFATTYRVNEQTGDELLVGLVGTAFMAPMFLGGIIAGAVTDRLDRHRTVARSLGLLIPLSALMGLAVLADRAPVGLSMVFVFCIGIGNVIDMTSRRSIAFGLVGAGLLTNVAAYETFALHAGNMTGSLIGGAVIGALGAGSVYLGIAAVYLVALATFTLAARTTRTATLAVAMAEPATTETPKAAAGEPGTSAANDLRAGLGLLRSNVTLRQFLMTTVVMNFFYYAFMPLVPAFAEDLGVGPFLTGLLAAAVGMGAMIGAFVIARLQPARRGLLHVGGSLGAMAMLIVFANMTWYPAAFAALFVAGLSGSGFGTTQSALVVSLVDESLRGRALGVLSMAIGALPFGMFSLGLLAKQTDPQLALTVSVAIGIVVLIAFHAGRPHLRSLA